MEITNKIKSKVFAQYLWGETTHSEYPMLTPSEVNENYKNNFKEGNEDVKLILKPLSGITDDDAFEVANLLNFKHRNIENGKAFVKELIARDSSVIHFHPLFIMDVYQYLISKGYDLPNYLLGGKTLQEAGLAIYE